MNWRTLFRLCLVAIVVATTGMAGAEYDIDEPDDYEQFLKDMDIDAEGSTLMGHDVDVDLYDGDGHAAFWDVIVPAVNVDWECSFDPDAGFGARSVVGEWFTGTGSVVLYKHGESTPVRDDKLIYIVAMP